MRPLGTCWRYLYSSRVIIPRDFRVVDRQAGGSVLTELTKELTEAPQSEISAGAACRFGTPKEIASAVAFRASDDAHSSPAGAGSGRRLGDDVAPSGSPGSPRLRLSEGRPVPGRRRTFR